MTGNRAGAAPAGCGGDWFLPAVLLIVVVAYPRVRPGARPAAARTSSPAAATSPTR